MSTPRLTVFRWSTRRYRGDGEEQQDGQNDGLHDDCSVERTADGMLWRVTATLFVQGTVRRRWGMKRTAFFFGIARLCNSNKDNVIKGFCSQCRNFR
jgi:hypothetical protein